MCIKLIWRVYRSMPKNKSSNALSVSILLGMLLYVINIYGIVYITSIYILFHF